MLGMSRHEKKMRRHKVTYMSNKQIHLSFCDMRDQQWINIKLRMGSHPTNHINVKNSYLSL